MNLSVTVLARGEGGRGRGVGWERGGCGGSIHVSVLFCRRHKSKTKEWHAEEDEELTAGDFSVIPVYIKAE